MTNPTPMTDEQCVLAMWELLGVCHRPEDLFCDYDEESWYDEYGESVHDPIAHRAILDAAREVLDDAEVYISKSPGNLRQWIFWMDRIYPSDPVASRTQATYHALAWLKGKSR